MTTTILPGSFDRRGFLASGAGLAVGGCMHCSFPAPVTAVQERVSDAHAHFFNAADLPVAGFAKFVLIPRYLPNAPDAANALVDIIAFVAKALTLTASEELRQIGSGTLARRGSPTPADFGRAAAKAHRAGLRGVALVPEVDALEPADAQMRITATTRASSHETLAGLLGTARIAGAAGGDTLDAAAFEAIAGEPPPPLAALSQVDDDLQCPNRGEPLAGAAPAGARTLLHWVYLMCRPRCRHVEEYLTTIARPGATVGDAINLLVDYDRWLNDHPRGGSDQAAQVAYWTRYADASGTVPGRIRLHTFAGYDPLRHAEERVLEKRTPSFETMKRWAVAGRDPASRAPHRIAGFKVYPPMGFRPDDNNKIRIPAARGGAAVRRRWGMLDEKRIGAEIDASLDEFFDFCAIEDIPVLTHARESNIALQDHGDDPAPYHWLARAKALNIKHRGRLSLRLCIGHFDLKNCPKVPTDHEALIEALQLNKAGKTRMYFDLSFDTRILTGDGKALLGELAEICTAAKDDGDYLMFGSDWIMLGNQPNAGRYLQLAYDAAREVTFWKKRLDKLFRGNLLRFVAPKTT